MSVVGASFDVPAGASSWQIATSLNEMQLVETEYGHQYVATAAVIPAGSPDSAAGPFTWKQNSLAPVWLPICQEVVSYIEIEIAPFPDGARRVTMTAPSSVTIAVRKVGAR